MTKQIAPVSPPAPATPRLLAVVTGAARALFYAAVMLAGPGYFGYHRQPTEMATAGAAGIALLFFLNLTRFKSFKGGGVEAQLVEAVKEAQGTAEQLRRLVKPLVTFSINQLTFGGRLGQMPKRELILGEVRALGREFGLEEDAALKADIGAFFRHEAWDRLNALVSHVHLTDKMLDVSTGLAPLAHRRPTVDFPSEADIREAFTRFGKSPSPEAEAQLREFLSYVAAHRSEARPE